MNKFIGRRQFHMHPYEVFHANLICCDLSGPIKILIFGTANKETRAPKTLSIHAVRTAEFGNHKTISTVRENETEKHF